MARFGELEALAPGHDVEEFDCRVESLNVWLTRHAAQAAAAGSARTFVVDDADEQRVVGYHALTVASIAREQASPRAARGMPRHPIPAALLARLAVDVSVQGRGIGT